MDMALLSTIAVLLVSAFSSGAKAANKYDYFQFVQQWPATFCYQNPGCVRNPPRNTFTIHGLWPSNYTTPENPCVGTPFSLAEMFAAPNHGLKDYFLPQAWPQLITRFTNMQFWQTEYNKHGTCSENKLKQTEYFRTAHWAWVRFNAYFLFAHSPLQIHPGNYYHKADLEQAIRAVTTKDPLLMCKKIKPMGIDTWLLQEVIICLDVLGVQPVPCRPRLSSCGGPIIYYGY
ncbi:ribonuclease MC-like [Rosa rugosa]|uniref:ribonuclease MC-like n=1 Tax=Rosa rugosa TaxID=74645 RepID=UPI002B41759F|nr:ribonuclease MC-like [Rosa rugosa]